MAHPGHIAAGGRMVNPPHRGIGPTGRPFTQLEGASADVETLRRLNGFPCQLGAPPAFPAAPGHV